MIIYNIKNFMNKLYFYFNDKKNLYFFLIFIFNYIIFFLFLLILIKLYKNFKFE